GLGRSAGCVAQAVWAACCGWCMQARRRGPAPATPPAPPPPPPPPPAAPGACPRGGRPASGLLGHGFKSSNSDRVFRRALFILRSVVFKGEKLHLHVRRAVTVQNPIDPAWLAVKGLKRPTGQLT